MRYHQEGLVEQGPILDRMYSDRMLLVSPSSSTRSLAVPAAWVAGVAYGASAVSVATAV